MRWFRLFKLDPAPFPNRRRRRGSYKHRIYKVNASRYRIEWSVAIQAGTRSKDMRRKRVVDKGSAERFCARWKLRLPKEIA